MIKRGAVINWLQETSTSDDPQKARDGYLRLPTWLEPVKAPVKEEPARNDGPATMSEMQKLGGGIRRGPEGSE